MLLRTIFDSEVYVDVKNIDPSIDLNVAKHCFTLGIFHEGTQSNVEMKTSNQNNKFKII